MATGALDIALCDGTDLLFVARGSPEKAVAVLGTSSANLSILVPSDSPIRSAADLKGKKIAATTVGSLTSWFAQEIARREGLGVSGIKLVYLGGTESMLAGLTTKTVDAASASLEVGHSLGGHCRHSRKIAPAIRRERYDNAPSRSSGLDRVAAISDSREILLHLRDAAPPIRRLRQSARQRQN